jgi:hypothetical protein
MFNNFFSFYNRAVYEIMWKNIVQLRRLQMTWMQIAGWIPKAQTCTQNIQKYCFSTATNVARTRLNYVIRTLLVSFTLSSTFFPNDNTLMSVNKIIRPALITLFTHSKFQWPSMRVSMNCNANNLWFTLLRLYKTKRSNNISGNGYNLAENPISVIQQFIGKCCLGTQTMLVVRTKLKPQIILDDKHWCWRRKL